MEKSGKKAGERAGKAASKAMNDEVEKGSRDLSGSFEREFHKSVDSVNKALGGIDIKRLSNDMRREVTSIKKELTGLKDVDITAEADFKRVYAEIAVLEGRLLGFRDGAKIVFRSDIDDALKGIAKIKAAKETISDPVEIEVRADTKSAERSMSLFEKKFKKTVEKSAKDLSGSMSREMRKVSDELDYLSNLRIGIDLSSGRARAELKEITAELERLSKEDADIDVRVDAAAALAELTAFEAQLAKLDKRDVKVDVDVDTKKATQNAQDASNVFRSFNIILLAAASVGPALIPVLAGIAGGLLALGPAAAVAAFGLSSALVGFSGLGDAVGALGAQQDAAATTAQTSANRQVGAARAIESAQEALSDARRNAARAAEDAADRVADAREAAADAIEDALERQKDAQEEYRDSVQDVRDAEQDLRDAREEARKDAETLAKRQRQNAVDERQAVLDLGQAQNDYNNVMADGSSTNTDREQAAVNLEQAQLALNDTRDEQVALSEEAADYAANGVDGSEQVKSAQDKVTEALEAQKEAQEAVKEAAEEADEARVDGAKAVNEALEDQRETLSDNARAIQNAKEAIADARQSAVSDLQQIDAQAQAVKTAFDKLGPAGRTFAEFLFGLRSGFYAFRDDVQKALLPAVQEAIESFISSPAAGKAKGVFVALAASFGEFVKALSTSLQGEAWTGFFEMMADLGPKIQDAYGGAFISFMEAMASILTTAAPFALRFAEGLEKMMDRFAGWADSKAGQDAILGFIEYVEEIGPSVLDFFSGLAGALVAVMKAMAPYGSIVLDVIDNFLEFITLMDSDILAALLTGLTVVLLASQVAYGLSVLSMSLGALFATTIGPWVFLIAGVIIALGILYKTNEDFRDFIDEAWTKIKEVFVEAWENHIKPALMALWEALETLWKEVLQPFLAWLAPILLWVIENLLPLLLRVFSEKIQAIAWAIKNILVPAARTMGRIFKWVWENILKPVWDDMSSAAVGMWALLKPTFEQIAAGWDLAMRGMKWVWKNVLEPIWNAIADVALPALSSAFETTVGYIGTLWDGLRALVANPIKFVIEKVLNGGLIAGFNKVSSWVKGPQLDPIAVPEELNFATGGVLPGYTPGRDVHTFQSPTAGTLNLSGGEAIMRPEWTAAMGPDYVERMNRLARRGGAKAVQAAMSGLGGYWNGGILPLLGGSVTSHGDAYGHYAADMNYPGYTDYGKPVVAWKNGVLAQKNYIGDDSYGRWAVVNHLNGLSSLYAHLSAFADVAVGAPVRGGQTIGYVGDIGNTGTPPTSHLHFEIMGGNVGFNDAGEGGTEGKSHRKIPSWLMGVIKDPLGAFKGWVTDPIKDAAASVSGSPLFESVSNVPLRLGKAVTDKVWGIIPGWAKTAAGWAGNAADWTVGGIKNAAGAAADIAGDVAGGISNGASAVGDFLGFEKGGILPYNGTMMYDNGGYLPPGLTNVVNLTGKPERVFTDGQFDDLGVGGGENFTYAPTFEGSKLTAADVVDDFDFTRRKIKREGAYGRHKL